MTMPGDPAIEAAARALVPIKAGSRTVGEHIAFGLYYWNAAGEERHMLTDIALAECAIAAIRAYLAAQPAERTAAEMRREIEG